MITSKELTVKLRSLPEAKSLFDQMADLRPWDAAYFLLLRKRWFDDIQYRAGLQTPPFVDDPTAQPVPVSYIGPRRDVVKFDPHELMFHRLKAVHPDAPDGRILEAIEAARVFNEKVWPLMVMEADLSGLRAVARLREECPGFEQKTYEMAYSDFRVANR